MTNTKLGCIWRDGCNQHDTCQQAGCCQGLRSNREMVIPDQEYEGPLKCSNCKRPLSEHAGIVCPELPPSKEQVAFEAWLSSPATRPQASPYSDTQIRHLYEAWCAAWKARAAHEPPVNDEIPRAWFRVTQTPDSPHGPFEPDIDMAWGDQPDGDGWKPLYLRPAPPPFDVQEILREVSSLDCFYTGASCPQDCECLSARAGRAIHPRATTTKASEHG